MAKLTCLSRDAFVKKIKEEGWLDNDIPNDIPVANSAGVAFISICEPWVEGSDNEWNKSIFETDHPNVLRLWFEDIDPIELKRIIDKHPEVPEKDKPNVYEWEGHPDFWFYQHGKRDLHLFNPDEAFMLWNFIKRNAGKDFYIHCFAGVSRSQAVTKFILDKFPEFYSEKDLNHPIYKCHNKWVYNLLNKASKKVTL